ncbi:putative lipoprotein [Myxococcus hansupus]|uniref:Putative lipoprotein n=1 Tax=Pseudomyxococcus hansupus TaxID=1297742 RepID=A0A0H4WK79_9BACT|nr:putative lipoprotein [Myxococcus hansupus]
MLTAGCGGPADEASDMEKSAEESPALSIKPPFDPELHCQVPHPYVDCGPGQPQAYAHYSAEWGYFIGRFACGGSQPICPF